MRTFARESIAWYTVHLLFQVALLLFCYFSIVACSSSQESSMDVALRQMSVAGVVLSQRDRGREAVRERAEYLSLYSVAYESIYPVQ